MTRSLSADFTIPGAESHYPPDLGLEPKHLDITLSFDIPARSAEGAVVTRVTANRPGERKLTLDACDLIDVEVSDPAGRELSAEVDGRRITVLWEEPFERGESREVRIAYRVDHPVSGLNFSGPDESYPDRASWVATDHETERARYWLPCVDQPAVRTTLSFHLTAPSDLVILANGILESEEENGDGTKTAHWRLDFPCPSYLLCLAVGEFVRVDDEPFEGRPLAYFGAKGRVTPEDLRRSYGRTPEIMRWLQEKTGHPFPFPKYYQFALPSFGGAMENISLVSWDDVFVTDETLAKDLVRTTDIINVHEMAHSYFGDAVVIRDFAHAWLKESWATYTEALWYEDQEGEDEFRYDLLQCARRYMKEADTRYQRPIVTRVYNSSWDMYDRHLYPGGAIRLHMLRRELGDEVFWPAVHDYLARYTGRTVETGDFRRVMEEHSGRSLVRFFEQWFYREGFPDLKVTFAHDAEKRQGTLTLVQKQVPEEKHSEKKQPGAAAPAPFEFDLVIAWERPDETWARRKVAVSERNHVFVFPMAAPPLQVRIDPDGSVVHRLEMNPGDKMLLRALRHAPDVVGRILAAEEMVNTGKRKNLEAVAEAWAEEGFWGARVMMAEAVGESRSALAPEILAEMLAREKDPRVLRVVVEQAGTYRDARIAAALTRVLDGDPTYLVAAASLKALGAQRGEAHLDRLRSAAEDEGYRGLVRSGALRGLAETRTDAALETLRGRTAYGSEKDDCAPHALGAYAGAARFAERRWRDRAVEEISDACRDPRPRVRRSAAVALGTLRAKEAVPVLERVLTEAPEQDHPFYRRIILKIRGEAGEKSEAAELRKDLEKLEERHRKLEDRVLRLQAKLEPDVTSP